MTQKSDSRKRKIAPFVARTFIQPTMRLIADDAIVISPLFSVLDLTNKDRMFLLELMNMAHPVTNIICIKDSADTYKPISIKDIGVLMRKRFDTIERIIDEFSYYGILAKISFCHNDFIVVNPYFASRGLNFNGFLGNIFNGKTLKNKYGKYYEHFSLANKTLCEEFFDKIQEENYGKEQ